MEIDNSHPNTSSGVIVPPVKANPVVVPLAERHSELLQAGKRIPLHGTALLHIRALCKDPTDEVIKAQLNHFRMDLRLEKLTELLRAIAAAFCWELFGEGWNDWEHHVKKYVRKHKRRWLGSVEEGKLVQGGLQAVDISALRCLIQGLAGPQHPVHPLLKLICDKRNALKHSSSGGGDLPVAVSECSERNDDGPLAEYSILSELERMFEMPQPEMALVPTKLDIHEMCPFLYLQYQTYLKLAKEFIKDRNYSVAGQVVEKAMMDKVRYEDGLRLMALLTMVLFFELRNQGLFSSGGMQNLYDPAENQAWRKFNEKMDFCIKFLVGNKRTQQLASPPTIYCKNTIWVTTATFPQMLDAIFGKTAKMPEIFEPISFNYS